MPVILPRARANGALPGLKLRTGSAPSDAANLHPASESHATLSPFWGSCPPCVQNCSPIAAVTPELASAPAKNKAVANQPCKGLWFLTTTGWVITRRFTSVVSLIIPLSQSRLSHRALLRADGAVEPFRRLEITQAILSPPIVPDASPLQGHDHALRRAGHFDAAPCRWPVRDGIRPAEGFINADRVEMCRLVTSHIDERQKETKAFAACIDGEDQSDGHHSSKTGVFRQDFVGLELFLESPGCVHQCGNSGACADRVIYFDAWTL